MSPTLGWSLAVLAVAVGYASWGWSGVALAVTVVVFWLLLQFNRAMRVMRAAGSRPVGLVKSAVMLQAGLAEGQTMMQVLQRTGAFGERLPVAPAEVADAERWRWHDAGGDAVVTDWRGGKLQRWRLERVSASDAPAGDGAAPAPSDPPPPNGAGAA
jgi:hypothetical protein